MPGTIKVSVSMGKKQYQTWDKGDFAFPLKSLRDVLVITVNNVERNEISRADIQAKSIVEKGFWDDHFSLAGGGRVHLQLQFSLNQDERDRIRTMRQSAMKKKQEEYHSMNFQSMGDATMARSNNASFNLNSELSDSQKYLLQVRELNGKDERNLSSPASTSIRLESGEKSSKTEEKQTEFDQIRQTPNDADREKDSSSTAPLLPEINIHRPESSQEKTDPIIDSYSLDDNVPLPSVSLEENTNLLKPSGLISLSEAPPFQSPDVLPDVDRQSSNEQLAQMTVTAPVDENPVQTISSEENIQPLESTVAYGIEGSISPNADEGRVHKAENRTPLEKTSITVKQMNTAFEGSRAQDVRLQIKIPLTETQSNADHEQKSLKEDQSMKPKKEKTKPSSSASDTEALIFEDPKHDEEMIKKRDQKIKLPESLKRTELFEDLLLQKSKATALGEKIEDSIDRPKEVYARDKPPDEKAESRPAEVFIMDQSKKVKEDIKKRDEKISVLELLERTKLSGDRLLQKPKTTTAREEKIEYSTDQPKDVNAMDNPRDEKAENRPTEARIKDQSKEVCMKNEIEPQEFIETSIMEVEAASVSERVAAHQLGKTQLANLVDYPVEMESTRKTPSQTFLEMSKPGVSEEEQHFSERSNIWIFPDDATKICITTGGRTLADLMGGSSGSSSLYQEEMRNSVEEHRGGSGSGVFKGAQTHPENRKSKPLISKGAETSEGRLRQTLNIAIIVGFGTLMLFTRQRKKRNNRVVVRSTNLHLRQ